MFGRSWFRSSNSFWVEDLSLLEEACASRSAELLRATVCRIFWKIRMQHRLAKQEDLNSLDAAGMRLRDRKDTCGCKARSERRAQGEQRDIGVAQSQQKR
mmetsp:Transcript_50409/g.109867  ORF Transcript_50409/g.109867 Transcript_50409/m.109867 type:complete len:100 (+) Transcript_50409:596-895(+)